MFDRPKSCRPFVYHYGEAEVAADNKPEAAFEAWLAQARATPRFCSTHDQIALGFARRQSGFWPVRDRLAKPGEIEFCAAFACPVCCTAHARCPLEFHATSFDTFD